MDSVSDQQHPADGEPTEPIRASGPGADEPLAIPAEARGTGATPVPPAESPAPRAGGAVPPPPAPDSLTPNPGGWAPPKPTEQLPVTQPAAPTRERAPRRATVLWPVICLLALLLGVGGGVLGAIGYDRWFEEETQAGRVIDGLADVDLNTQAPLDESGTVAEVADAVVPSTVRILAEFQGEEGGATGTGWVFDDQGHIVTNNHVVADAAEHDGPIQIVDQDGNHHDATVVGRSPVYDLALLHAEGATDLPAAAIGRADGLRVGDAVVAIGYPLGLNTTVTSGIVSALGQPVSTGNTEDDMSYINAVQTDAAINPGNSGGPLVNAQGQVVGVNSAIATNGGGSIDSSAGNIGVGFAIPIEQVLITVDQILTTGEAQYPLIGAQVQTGGVQEQSGGLIVEVVPDSPAAAAGLEPDDIITAVNGEKVSDGLHLIVVIRSYQPGETIEFTLDRGGERETVEITLDGEVG